MKKTRSLDFLEDSDIELPLDVLMQTIFVGGNKGAGKTSALKRLFEAAHKGGAQCGAIAPLGRWWSLRIAKNGKGKGLSRVFVFGGKHGDVPITGTSGRAVARTVVQKRVHFVLDVELMRKGDRAQFLGDFLEELWQLKKEEDASHAMVLFIDEAQNVAPQRSSSKEVERMREFTADLCREGRNHGIGMVLGAQRSANVDKDLLALVEVLLVMRTVHHLDRKVYQAWVDEKGGGEDEEEYSWLRKLRRLSKGEAYLYAPELKIFERVKVKLPDTYDATATASLGARVAKIGRLSRLDVRELGEEMRVAVESATENAPAALRARIADLERQLATRPKVSAEKPKAPPKIDKRALARLEKWIEWGKVTEAKVKSMVDGVKPDLAKLQAAVLAMRADRPATLAPPRRLPKVMGASSDASGAASSDAPGSITPYARDLLKTAVERLPMKMSRAQLGVLSGRSRKSSAFSGAVAALLREGFLVDEGDNIVPTQKGLDEIGAVVPVAQTREEVRAMWLRQLPKYESELLSAALKMNGVGSFSRSDLAGAAQKSITSSAFSSSIARLKKNGLFVEAGQGLAVAELLS